MGNQGVELNGGIIYTTKNLTEFGDQLPKYNGLRTISFAKGTVNNSWIKILDENFQSDVTQFGVADRKLTRMAVSFIGTTSFSSESSSQGMFILSILVKQEVNSPYSFIASIDITPLTTGDKGMYTEAIVGYKNLTTSPTYETNVKCYINLPFANDDLQLTPIFFKTDVHGTGNLYTSNPVGDANYFNEYQRIKGLFDVNNITNMPSSAVDYTNMMSNLSGYTLSRTNTYKPTQSSNIIWNSNNRGNLALQNGWTPYSNQTMFSGFSMSNCLSYSRPYDCFIFNNNISPSGTPNISDIQLIYTLPNYQVKTGVYTITLYYMCDSIASVYYSVFDNSLNDLATTDLNPSSYSIPIDNNLVMKKFVKKVTLTSISDNSVRIYLGNIPTGANFYFAVKMEYGYNSSDHSVSARDSTILWASKPPTSMTWEQGRIIFNTTTQLGFYSGWVCVAGGSPGTWVGFGQAGTQKGATSSRPLSSDIGVGYTYLDTTLAPNGKLIIWNGTNWIDATGTIV